MLVIVPVVVAAYIFITSLRQSGLPDYSADTVITGLSAGVTIYRDSLGIPHIYAENEADLYMAVGFAMAQDRLWQMDLLRRVTQGRLSEILGKDQVMTDLLMRSLRIQEKSEKILAGSSSQIVAALEAFAAGINFYIENHQLPAEFRVLRYKPEPWQPVHSLNLIGYMSWDLASGWGAEMLMYSLAREIGPGMLQDMLPRAEVHHVPVYPDFSFEDVPGETILTAADNLEKLGVQVFHGSNNWAVAGSKSTTGKPLLANDMHLGLFAPGIWYQMHQVVTGSLNVTGVVLPGQPFVISGHNDSIAWGMTNVMVDDLDFYVETLNDDSTHYLLDGQWRELVIREEKILTGKKDTVTEILRFTHRGPIVSRFKNEREAVLSIRWMGNEMSNELRSVYLLNRAAGWEDFRDAVSTFTSVSQNIVYADVAGNIGLQTSAGVPVRYGSGMEIYPGDTSLYDWRGVVPFEELPFEFNPERGYVSSANNRTTPDGYPYLIGNWYAIPDRIGRLRDMLAENERHGVDDFMKMHGDFRSKQAERFLPSFLEALKGYSSWNKQEQAAYAMLEDWDLVMSSQGQAPAIYDVFYRRVAENLVKDKLSPELFMALMGQRMIVENFMANMLEKNNRHWIDNQSARTEEPWNDIAVRAFRETVTELEERLGTDPADWNWGSLHTLTVRHPLGTVKLLDKVLHLNRGPYSVPGSYHTLTPYSYSFTNLYEVNHGASHRHIYDLSDWDASKTVIPTGTSGIPSSEFYLDQTRLYIQNRYHDDPFSMNGVQKKSRFSMKLLPGNHTGSGKGSIGS